MQLRSRDDASYYALYQYTPELAPAIIAAALFLLGTIAHIRAATQLRCKIFIPFVIGCLMESVGYGGRIWSHYDVTSIGAFVIQAILILIAPALFAASIYMVLGRIIAHVDGERFSLIRLRWLTKAFVIGDCLSFLLQACGGGIQAGGTLDLLHLGEKIIVVGLFLQIFFFGIFLVCAVTFHVRIRARPTQRARDAGAAWQRHMAALYLTSVIILVRSIFRVVEYLMGNDGFILQHEYMLYVFDAILMFGVVIIFLFHHPGKLFLENWTRHSPSPSQSMEIGLLEQGKH